MAAEYAVSVHDVAPATWEACQPLLALIDALAAPATLLVVPHYHAGLRIDADPGFAAALRQRLARGDEIVLHGYWHEDRGPRVRSLREWLERRVYTAREGEFAAVADSTAASLIARGCADLARLGLAPAGFVPPAWLMNAATLAALARSGLRYASTRDRLIELRSGRSIWAPSLVYSTRAPWRRAASRRWNRLRLARFARSPRVRAALHPADAGHRAVLADWARLLGELAAVRTAALESSWLGRR